MGRIIFTGAIGLLVIYMGILIAFKKRIDLINGYHYKHVRKEQYPMFCRMEGTGNIITGIGFILLGILYGLIGRSGYLVGLIFIFGGIIVSAMAIIRYNIMNQIKKRSRH